MSTRKIKSWFEFFTYLFPVFAFILCCIYIGNGFQSLFSTFSSLLNSLNSIPFIKPIYDFVNTSLLGGINNNLFDLSFALITYYFVLTLVWFLFDVLLFVVNWVRKWFNRFD